MTTSKATRRAIIHGQFESTDPSTNDADRQYEAAHEAHYKARDLHKAIEFYKDIIVVEVGLMKAIT